MIEPLSSGLEGVNAVVPDDLSTLPGLSVTADPGQFACRLQLVGRLDADTVPLLTACVTSWVDRGMTHLVLDMTEVTQVDAAGAAALARATHVLGRCGGSVHVIPNPDPSIDVTTPAHVHADEAENLIGVRHVR